MKIVHITSAHPSLDSRIFYKECMTLLTAGHCVHLVSPQSEFKDYAGIKIHALNSDKHLSRWQRLWKIYQLAKNLSADVYHFHDPEFIPFALLLKIRKNKIIYDVHEDTPRESLSFNKNSPIKAAYKYARWVCLEKICKFLFDGFVCATPYIAQNFPKHKTVTVCNYVKIEEFNYPFIPFSKRSNTAIYAGGIMRVRGLQEMLKAVALMPDNYQAKLKLAGQFSPPLLEKEAESFVGWNRAITLGWLSRQALLPHFYASKVGLVILHPERNFKEALPIKLFEYMAAGLPVIASDFPLWRDIVLRAECGFVVDPFDSAEICKKMQFIFTHPIEAEAMGRRGQQAVAQQYNWQSQAEYLIQFYLALSQRAYYE